MLSVMWQIAYNSNEFDEMGALIRECLVPRLLLIVSYKTGLIWAFYMISELTTCNHQGCCKPSFIQQFSCSFSLFANPEQCNIVRGEICKWPRCHQNLEAHWPFCFHMISLWFAYNQGIFRTHSSLYKNTSNDFSAKSSEIAFQYWWNKWYWKRSIKILASEKNMLLMVHVLFSWFSGVLIQFSITVAPWFSFYTLYFQIQ